MRADGSGEGRDSGLAEVIYDKDDYEIQEFSYEYRGVQDPRCLYCQVAPEYYADFVVLKVRGRFACVSCYTRAMGIL